MSNVCENCKYSFSTKYTLENHRKNSKKCSNLLKEQNKDFKQESTEFICICNKIFSSSFNLKRHKTICEIIKEKNNEEQNNIQQLNFLKEEITKKNSLLLSNEKDIEYMKKEITEYKKEILAYKKEIDDYKRQINNFLNKESSRVDSSLNRPSSVVNNTNINAMIINNMKPLEISLDRFNSIIEHDYTIGKCNDKEKGVVEILKTFFSDEYGSLQAICSDKNRGWIITIDQESNQVSHTFDTIKNMISESTVLKDKIYDYSKHYLRDEYIGQEDAEELGLARSTETQQLFRDNFKTSYDMFKLLCFNHYNALKRQRMEDATGTFPIRNI
jgi:hypothetical protein